MSQSALNYDDYNKINELIEGYANVDSGTLALANRPLPSVKQCPCLHHSALKMPNGNVTFNSFVADESALQMRKGVKEGRNDLTKVKPYYNGQGASLLTTNLIDDRRSSDKFGEEFQQSIGNSDKEIPVIIKKKKDQYLVLESKTDDNVYVDSWADLPKTEIKEQKQPKMDRVTQFYVGSISVVALFIVFRMIQKTK
jgi:hypothetical protein